MEWAPDPALLWSLCARDYSRHTRITNCAMHYAQPPVPENDIDYRIEGKFCGKIGFKKKILHHKNFPLYSIFSVVEVLVTRAWV